MIDNPISDIISKDLRRWFKEKWVDVSRKDKDGKHPPCGRSNAKTDSKGYPKCRPSKKVSDKTPKTTRSMSATDKKRATRRKRSKPQGVGGKPTMVKSRKDEKYTREGLPVYPCKICGTPMMGLVENFTGICNECSELRTNVNAPDFPLNYRKFGNVSNIDYFTASAEPFEEAWDSVIKGKFRGYTRSSISERPYRQSKHKAYELARKVQRERTKRRYKRSKDRGVVRPKMRRQLGRGGKRASTTR